MVGAVTVNIVEPLISPEVAVIVVVPAAIPLAMPEVLIVATLGVDEVHVAVALRSCVLLSEYLPVALNCCDVPCVTEVLAVFTLMELSIGVAGAEDPPPHPPTIVKQAKLLMRNAEVQSQSKHL